MTPRERKGKKDGRIVPGNSGGADLALLLILAFLVLIAIGAWQGDFGETWSNGTTL